MRPRPARTEWHGQRSSLTARRHRAGVMTSLSIDSDMSRMRAIPAVRGGARFAPQSVSSQAAEADAPPVPAR